MISVGFDVTFDSATVHKIGRLRTPSIAVYASHCCPADGGSVYTQFVFATQGRDLVDYVLRKVSDHEVGDIIVCKLISVDLVAMHAVVEVIISSPADANQQEYFSILLNIGESLAKRSLLAIGDNRDD